MRHPRISTKVNIFDFSPYNRSRSTCTFNWHCSDKICTNTKDSFLLAMVLEKISHTITWKSSFVDTAIRENKHFFPNAKRRHENSRTFFAKSQWRWLAFETMLSSGAYTQEWGTVIWLDAWELVISESCRINKLWLAEISTPLLISYVHAPVKTNTCLGNCLRLSASHEKKSLRN